MQTIVLNNSLKNLNNNRSTHVTPRTVRKQYSTVNQQQIEAEPAAPPAQIVYVYCSPRLKSALGFLWKLLLLAYVVAIPIFVFSLHRESESNMLEINKLRAEFQTRAQIFEGNNEKKPSRKRRDVKKANSNWTFTQTNARGAFERNYFTPTKEIEERIDHEIRHINKTVEKYKKRMSALSKAERWANRIYHQFAGNLSNLACDCQRKTLVDKFNSNQGKTKVPGPRGIPGKKGERGRIGERGPQGPAGINMNCNKPPDVTVTYTRWGSSSCVGNATLLYRGYISYGQSNNLCLPRAPYYPRNGREDRSGKKTSINIFGVELKCAQCQLRYKSETLVMPADTRCPEGWSREFGGFLKSGSTQETRANFVCVDDQAASHQTLVSIVVQGAKGYKDTSILPCTVCSK